MSEDTDHTEHTGHTEVTCEIDNIDDPVQLASLKSAFSGWLTTITPAHRRMVEQTGLNPWDKYTLSARPHRAMYYRIETFHFCKGAHMVLTLLGYFYTGEFACHVEPVLPEHLIPYPYGPPDTIPADIRALEDKVIARFKALEAVLPVGIQEKVFGGRGDPTADVLDYDDRHGKKDGH